MGVIRVRIFPGIGRFALLFMHMHINAKIFCFFGFFGHINSKFFINYTNRLNSTRAIDWCINFHAWLEKKFEFFFQPTNFKVRASSTRSKGSKITELFQGWVGQNEIIYALNIHFYLHFNHY
jgi:hypothetical protein